MQATAFQKTGEDDSIFLFTFYLEIQNMSSLQKIPYSNINNYTNQTQKIVTAGFISNLTSIPCACLHDVPFLMTLNISGDSPSLPNPTYSSLRL